MNIDAAMPDTSLSPPQIYFRGVVDVKTFPHKDTSLAHTSTHHPGLHLNIIYHNPDHLTVSPSP